MELSTNLSFFLYGFASSNDQNMFKLLQTVQGVGPRAALSILSTLNVDEIILAISSGDKAMISRADGIGPKVAGRITTELVEKQKNVGKVSNIRDVPFPGDILLCFLRTQ